MSVDPYKLAESISAGYEAFVVEEMHREPINRRNVWAGSFHPCLRNQVLHMTDGDKLPPLPAERLAAFRRGKDRERDVLKADLSRVGRNHEPPFEVNGAEERFELKHKETGQVVLSGKIDCRLDWATRLSTSVEFKAWSPFVTQRINRFEDLWRSPWTRKGAYQLLTYLLGRGEEIGFLCLDTQTLPKILPVRLEDHLDKAEEFYRMAERALEHKDAGTLPGFLDGDPSECRRCEFFGNVCNPPLDYGEGAKVISTDWEPTLTRLDELKNKLTGKEWDELNKLNKKVKEGLRGVESGICGEFFISGDWQNRTKRDYPQEIAERRQREEEEYAEVDPKGAFVLKIRRVGQ